MATPTFLTVEEAAAVLRIGRTPAYEAARRYRATNGAEGIPVYKVGGTLRVPRHKLEEIAGGTIDLPVGRIDTRPTELPRATVEQPAPATFPRRRDHGDGSAQPGLPFTA